MRRKSGIIIKKPTNKGKGKVIHLQAYLAPEGSTRLRFRDFETVGISVKSLSQPQGQSAAGRMMSYFMFRPCKKKNSSQCLYSLAVETMGDWQAGMDNSLQISDKWKAPLPLPKHFFFVQNFRYISMHISFITNDIQ